jgi:hypothetical protein
LHRYAEVMLRMTDAQIEVRLLAGDTLIGFLKGVGARVHSAEALRARCLAAAAPPPRKKRKGAKGADGAEGGEAGEAAAATAETLRRHGGAVQAECS